MPPRPRKVHDLDLKKNRLKTSHLQAVAQGQETDPLRRNRACAASRKPTVVAIRFRMSDTEMSNLPRLRWRLVGSRPAAFWPRGPNPSHSCPLIGSPEPDVHSATMCRRRLGREPRVRCTARGSGKLPFRRDAFVAAIATWTAEVAYRTRLASDTFYVSQRWGVLAPRSADARGRSEPKAASSWRYGTPGMQPGHCSEP